MDRNLVPGYQKLLYLKCYKGNLYQIKLAVPCAVETHLEVREQCKVPLSANNKMITLMWEFKYFQAYLYRYLYLKNVCVFLKVPDSTTRQKWWQLTLPILFNQQRKSCAISPEVQHYLRCNFSLTLAFFFGCLLYSFCHQWRVCMWNWLGMWYVFQSVEVCPLLR